VLTDQNEYACCDREPALELTNCYQFWVCENLGGEAERVQSWPIDIVMANFAPLMWSSYSASLTQRLIAVWFKSASAGLTDQLFLSFSVALD